MRRTLAPLVGLALALLVGVDRVAAHVGGLSGSVAAGSIPVWLTAGTGGLVVGASFLVTSFATDHDTIRRLNGRGVTLPTPDAVAAGVRWTAKGLGVAVLLLVVTVGFVGPSEPVSNAAILVVWSGWWAGYTMSVYLLGNTWPAVNPWRTLAEAVARLRPSTRTYPERLGSWPAVVGLLGLVLVEVVSPLAEDARLLAALVVGYTLATVAGATLYGVETWFGRVDPIARVFHLYGQVAPVQRTETGLKLALPTTNLTEVRFAGHETPLVVALLWATTFDGLVTTPGWAGVTRAVVGIGVPAPLVYLATMLGGYALFLTGYRLAAEKARETADSYVTAAYIDRWFVAALLPIAVGYHLAHYLSYFLTLLPLLLAALASPFTPAVDPVVLALPAWFNLIQLGFVLLGHLFAIWVAHSLAFDLFPGVLTPIRSQYPFIAVMICYTAVSVWIVAQPFVPPPYT
ncbi:hypothetical protein [Halorarius litoreus]|uniref:hypothetical protein n=1 Tax=Halorarius litoreus TaxID=2962676 RepID=UPI0020CD755E|nr:hypothetical protein [Halorarius litoreus]